MYSLPWLLRINLRVWRINPSQFASLTLTSFTLLHYFFNLFYLGLATIHSCAKDFIRLIPKCPLCNSDTINDLNLLGMMTRFATVSNHSQIESLLACLLYCHCVPNHILYIDKLSLGFDLSVFLLQSLLQ